MKKIVLSLVMAISAFVQLSAQNINGSWEGVVSFQGTEMTLIFNISEQGNEITATMDSPTQGAFGIPTDVSTFVDNVLTIEHKQFGLKYIGRFKDESFNGTFYQGGMEFPLVLTPKKPKQEATNNSQSSINNGIVGSWEGTASFQGTEMKLVFNISENNEGFSSTMDSPAQGAMGIPMDKTTFENNKLSVEFAQAGFTYEGVLEGKSIKGKITQGGMEFPLELSKNTTQTLDKDNAKSYNFQAVMQEKMTSNLEDKLYTKAQVAEDVDFYLKTMHEVCPNPYLNADSLKIAKIAQDIKSKGDRSGRALHLDFMRLSSAFKAGHIYVASPMQMVKKHFDEGGTLLPFSVFEENGIWKVNRTWGEEAEQLLGKVIHSINDIDIKTFLKEAEQYVHREGDIADAIGSELNFFLWLKGIEPPYKTIWSNDANSKKHTVTVKGVDILKETNTELEEEEKISLSDFITFKILQNKVGYLNLKSMALFDADIKEEYYAFVKSTFAEIENKNLKHLIVDLRENSGGQGNFAEEILPYFANKPYQQAAGETRRVSQQYKDFINEMPEELRIANLKQAGLEDYPTLPNGTDLKSFDNPPPLKEVPHKFKGKVWCLIGPGTFSAGMMMANAIEDYDLGTLVGEPTGGIPNELSDVLPTKTPNSKIAFMVPSVIFTRANGDAKNTNPVLPDVEIKTTEANIESGKDPVLDYVLKKIHK